VGQFDLAKIARECLKNLTGEDFMQLAQTEAHTMGVYENQFQNA